LLQLLRPCGFFFSEGGQTGMFKMSS
jgi:hypothetical protein